MISLLNNTTYYNSRKNRVKKELAVLLQQVKKKIECLINGDHNTAPPPAGRHGYLRATQGTRSGATMLITTGPPP